MNTQALHIDHRRMRLQSWRHMLYAFIAAVLFNLLCVFMLSALIDPSPEPTPTRRLHQIQQQEPITQPPRDQQLAQEKAIAEVLPPVPAMPLSQVAHAFTFPGSFNPTAQETPWHAQMNLAGLTIPEASIVLDKRARLKFIPDLGRFYPRAAKRQGITGHTLLELVVGTDGRVESYTIKESVPQGVFEEQVSKVIPHIRYDAAELDGKAHTDRRLFKLTWGIQ